ncbi:hypothetical protein CRG98_003046 [Punica granatum]|uniref:Sulfotransferase n=1 Tax=Punica granatum TaxID=22663 RepID=A0A2I0L7A6_PUNGR|nr:hypothetical protein CRG98_003046 [Punica granatum]
MEDWYYDDLIIANMGVIPYYDDVIMNIDLGDLFPLIFEEGEQEVSSHPANTTCAETDASLFLNPKEFSLVVKEELMMYSPDLEFETPWGHQSVFGVITHFVPHREFMELQEDIAEESTGALEQVNNCDLQEDKQSQLYKVLYQMMRDIATQLQKSINIIIKPRDILNEISGDGCMASVKINHISEPSTTNGRKRTRYGQLIERTSLSFKLPDDFDASGIDLDKLEISRHVENQVEDSAVTCQFSFFQRLEGWKIECIEDADAGNCDLYYYHVMSRNMFPSIEDAVDFMMFEIYAAPASLSKQLCNPHKDKQAQSSEALQQTISGQAVVLEAETESNKLHELEKPAGASQQIENPLRDDKQSRPSKVLRHITKREVVSETKIEANNLDDVEKATRVSEHINNPLRDDKKSQLYQVLHQMIRDIAVQLQKRISIVMKPRDLSNEIQGEGRLASMKMNRLEIRPHVENQFDEEDTSTTRQFSFLQRLEGWNIECIEDADGNNDLGNDGSAPYAFYENFWCSLKVLSAFLPFQSHFTANDSNIVLISLTKAGTTWLEVLTFSNLRWGQFPPSSSGHPLLFSNPHELIPLFEYSLYGEPCQLPDLTS